MGTRLSVLSSQRQGRAPPLIFTAGLSQSSPAHHPTALSLHTSLTVSEDAYMLKDKADPQAHCPSRPW